MTTKIKSTGVEYSDGSLQKVAGLGTDGQKWQLVTRSANVTYINDTGQPIQVIITADTGQSFQVSDNGLTWVTIAGVGLPYTEILTVTIPNTHSYRFDGVAEFGTLQRWVELR